MTRESTRTPVAPSVPPGSGVLPGSTFPTAPSSPTPEFTELTTRRLGPVRAYFVRHPVVMDLLVMAWFVIPALLSALAIAPPGPDLPRTRMIVGLLCTLGTAAALWWRRRRPVVTLTVITVLAVVAAVVSFSTNGLELAVAFCIYAVAASGPARRSWTTFAGSTLLLVAALIWSGSSVESVNVESDGVELSALTYQVTSATAVLIFNLVALAIGTGVHNRRQHVASLIERGNRLALERDQREQLAVVAERSRIARELHDVVAHSLTVMIALSDGAAGIAQRDPERARDTMQDVSETGRTALADMRRVLGVLRSEGADGSPDAADLLSPSPTHGVDDLVAQFRGAGLAVSLVNAGAALPADSGLRLAVYRIVQEALTNVLRYAPLAPAIEVRIERSPLDVVVEVTNTAGPGNHPHPGGSRRGLIGMRERVAVYSGSLEAGPTPQGWRVRAVLPWEDEA